MGENIIDIFFPIASISLQEHICILIILIVKVCFLEG